jgi:hypothetical protein
LTASLFIISAYLYSIIIKKAVPVGRLPVRDEPTHR